MIQVTLPEGSYRRAQVWIDQGSKAQKEGASEGIEKSIGDLADKVRASTPVKSGKAQAGVESKMTNALTGRVFYDKSVAWYIYITDVGSRGHPIFPKGRAGNRESRALTKYLRHTHSKEGTTAQKGDTAFSKAARSKGAEARRSAVKELARAGVLSPETISALSGKGGSLNTARLALHFGNRFAAWAQHPGIRGPHRVESIFTASQEAITMTIDTAIAEKLKAADHE